MRAARAILGLLALAWCGQARADTTDLETEYRLAAERVHKHASDFSLDGKPQGEHALSRAWTLLAEWTAAYLNEHPDATPKRLKRAAPSGDLDAVPLGPRRMLVSAAVGTAFGTVFIVDGSDGSFRPVWSIRGRAGREAFPLLDAWTAKGAEENCRKMAADADWGRCGSLGGTAQRLPDDAQGHPRFYVEAGYSEAAGNTEAKQLSFWTWTGATAEPQFVTTYSANLDDEYTQLDGDVLKVRTGEDYRMISPWWDHLDRALDWRFRVGPDRIEDLGKTPLVPEMDIVDEILVRAAHRQPADDIATRAVQAQAAKIIADSGNVGEDGEPSLAMAGSSTLRREDGRTLVCLPSDAAGNLTFTLTGTFVSDLSVTPNDTGNFCPPDKP
ncbi:MAG TPA: hypothetical protein VFV07_03350 [Rhizomicrobium sp.]|nr:hypothetical protein [Rhizomicrobium sp.]